MANSNKYRAIQLNCLEELLGPIVRYSLRQSNSFQDFAKLAKVVFVRAAEAEILKTSEKVNVSRISAVTGIYRDDITRIFREGKRPSTAPLSVIGRVIGQWEQDSRFLSKAGKPRTLSHQGEDSEFRKLVFTVSQHLNPGTILFEMERMGAIKKTKNGIKLQRQMAPPGGDPRKGFELLAQEIDSLIGAIEENLSRQSPVSNLHIRTEYDNVFEKDLPEIRRWLIKEGKKLHRKARDFLSKFDQDVHPNPDERAGAKVSLTAYSLTSQLVEAETKKKKLSSG